MDVLQGRAGRRHVPKPRRCRPPAKCLTGHFDVRQQRYLPQRLAGHEQTSNLA
jgi:hypothetical protein